MRCQVSTEQGSGDDDRETQGQPAQFVEWAQRPTRKPKSSRKQENGSAHHDDVNLAEEQALAVIAEHVETNVRALEGALIRVVAFSSLTGRPLTGSLP